MLLVGYRENELVETGRKKSASEKEQVYLFRLSKRASRRRAFNDSKNTLRIEEKRSYSTQPPFPSFWSLKSPRYRTKADHEKSFLLQK